LSFYSSLDVVQNQLDQRSIYFSESIIKAKKGNRSKTNPPPKKQKPIQRYNIYDEGQKELHPSGITNPISKSKHQTRKTPLTKERIDKER